jgi:hypothetical protein
MKTITVAKPVLGLAKAAHRNGIQAEHDGQEDRAPQHPIHTREPVGHDQLRGHQIDRNGDGPVVPIVPAQGEAKALIDVARAVGGE